jgi:signal transduction histidine kinase/DNA-binding NarL/FixJ family response regulator
MSTQNQLTKSLIRDLRNGVALPISLLAFVLLPLILFVTWLNTTQAHKEKQNLLEETLAYILREPIATGNDFEVLKRTKGIAAKFGADICVLEIGSERVIASSGPGLECSIASSQEQQKLIRISNGVPIARIQSRINVNRFEFSSFGIISGAAMVLLLLLILFRQTSVVKVLLLDLQKLQSLGKVWISPHELERLTFRYGEFEAIKNILVELAKTISLKERDSAIAQMTQMVAHDIRKPFSMFRAMIDTIEAARSASELKAVSHDFLPEINKAMNAVNGLLQDILEVSSKAEPHLEPVRPESLVETALTDLFSMQEDFSVALEYDFHHTKLAQADSQKLMRVFLNIAGNAVQAMQGRGYLRFATRDKDSDGKAFVQFSILNTGSFIAADDLTHLFEAFFTKGKKGGTGLGLAIAQKVVHAHGGTIECRSGKDSVYPKGYVEFLFLVPAGGPSGTIDRSFLPAHSSDFRAKLAHFQNKNSDDAPLEMGTLELEERVLEKLKSVDRKLSLLMVDDEQIYKNAIRLHRDRSPRIAERLSLEFAKGSLEVSLQALDGAILDVDLGPSSLDGFELATDLRARFPDAFLCIHSNRTFPDDFKKSLNCGADAFLPKPMSYDHFLRFLAQVLHRVQADIAKQTSDSSSLEGTASREVPRVSAQDVEGREPIATVAQKPIEKNVIVVVDDSKIARISWQMRLKGTPFELFESPEAFFERCSDQSFVNSVKVVVTDYHFGTLSMLTGYDFALQLKSRYLFPVVLSSDGIFDEEEQSAFAAVIPKSGHSVQELDALL